MKTLNVEERELVAAGCDNSTEHLERLLALGYEDTSEQFEEQMSLFDAEMAKAFEAFYGPMSLKPFISRCCN